MVTDRERNQRRGLRKRTGDWFGEHPRGLLTLCLTEMWERFSFYGIQAILVLYLSASVSSGGLGLQTSSSNAIYGLYAGMVYIFSLPGGWLADRVLGEKRAVWWGGIVIALAHFTMAVPAPFTIYLGLAMLVIGTGLLKPNISALLGKLYEHDLARREAGYSLFYMGINVGAFLAPLIVGTLGEDVSWHLGFAAAGVGMLGGLVQYRLGSRHLRGAGDGPARPLRPDERRRVTGWVAVAAAGVGGAALLVIAAGLTSQDEIVAVLGVGAVLIAVVYFARILLDKRLTDVERLRMRAFLWLFVFAAAFWLVTDQAGSVLNEFAQKSVDRDLLWFQVPASAFQSVGPLLIVCLAPVFGWLWVRAGDSISTPSKFTMGLVFAGVSYVLMAWAATGATGDSLVSPLWLVAVYFLQVCGELSLSPVGLAVTTELGPKPYAGQMMGLWFLAATVGDSIGGQVSRLEHMMPEWGYFLVLGAILVLFGLAATGFRRHIGRLMAGRR